MPPVLGLSETIYLLCSGAGSILLGKTVRSARTSEGGIGNEANSLAPIASAFSATKRWSAEYWFLKNSSIRALFKFDERS